MKNEPQKGSGIPMIIIGVVLIAAVAGAYFLYNSSQTPANRNTAAGNKNSNRTVNSAAAPLGANPPNMLGSPTASVTVEEFADFQCPACASVHPTMKEIQSTYGNRIRFIFRNFPLAIPQHDKAYEAAVASEAVRMQDSTKFWDFQNKLYENQQAWSANPNYRQIWEGYVRDAGLDVEKFKADMAGSAAKKRVDEDIQRGRGLSVDSTPTVFINGKNIPLESINVANLRQVIDAEIQNAIKTQPAANGAPASNSAANSNAAK
ncbi:MAG: thioredoxin domain-containing protein [Acidobacteria bacterium]|nr:thioredoxin domain-containing protein [Acidobacteriota bacterium]